MSDNLPFSANPSVNIASDDIGGVHYQIIKLATGDLDVITLVSNNNPLPVTAPPSTTNATFGSVIVTALTGVVRGSNPTRVGLTLQNVSSSVDVYWGNVSGVTTVTGLLLAAGQSVEIDARYSGAIHAITTAGSADVRYWELS